MVDSAPNTISAAPAAATRQAVQHLEMVGKPTPVLRSVFVWAALAFIVLSTICAGTRFGQNRPENFPFMGWTAWAIQDFLEKPKPPNVAFLGSSLMLVPLSGVDADHLNQRLDGAQHHHCVYFQDEFKRQTGCAIDTFNFALPGEMPSDAFMITDFILARKRPGVVIYGVGPRDFTDNLLPNPASTDPYRFLSRFDDVSPHASLMMPDWQERLSFELGKAIYFYGQRADLVRNSQDAAAKLAATFLPLPPGVMAVSPDARHALLPDYMPTELHKGQAFFRPTAPEERKHFTDNLDEYRQRYAKLKKRTFDTQLAFFNSGLESARRNGIHTVIIAMPITDVNRQLLPDSTWNTYKQSVRNVVETQGATFIDLSESKEFVLADFCDTVHLHSGGGKKLLDKVIAAMAADTRIMDAVKGHAAKRFLSDNLGGGCAAN
jgi:hypothetical protein